jgi:hypothetical protein
MNFCDNRLCRLHAFEIPGPEYDLVTYTEANGKNVKSRRWSIYVDGKAKVDLCDICAYAVAMVNELSDSPRTSAPLSPQEGTPGGDAKSGDYQTIPKDNQ